MGESIRKTGRTAKQMQEAPQGAIYIWPNRVLGYPMALAKHLGRTDLLIRSPAELKFSLIRGSNRRVVFDHATIIDHDGFPEAMEVMQYLISSERLVRNG